MPEILNPDIYKKAKEIADQTFEKHGAYKSAFLVKKYKELGGKYKDDGKPRNLSRWLSEDWKDVNPLKTKTSYPVYRPTKRVSAKTPLTADEVSPESLQKNAVLKQIYGAERNLPAFKAKSKGAGFYKMENGCSLYTGGALSSKRIASFSDSVQTVFNLLSISRKYTVVGSAALNEIKYSADYDLNEFFKEEISDKGEILDRLYKIFRDKFKVAASDPDIYITDFKCGEDSNGEPLRWDYADILRGTKTLENGRKVSFQECLLMKATLKLDMVVVIDGRFVEFSDNYFLKLGNSEANYFPHDIEKGMILNGLAHDYYFNIQSSGNLMKALKRLFSYLRLENEGKNESKLDKLIEFFNSDAGLLYKINSEIKTIISIIDTTFRVVPRNQVRENLSLILPELRGTETAKVKARLSAAMSAKTKTQIRQHLADASKDLEKIINESTMDFITKNKNLTVL